MNVYQNEGNITQNKFMQNFILVPYDVVIVWIIEINRGHIIIYFAFLLQLWNNFFWKIGKKFPNRTYHSFCFLLHFQETILQESLKFCKMAPLVPNFGREAPKIFPPTLEIFFSGGGDRFSSMRPILGQPPIPPFNSPLGDSQNFCTFDTPCY